MMFAKLIAPFARRISNMLARGSLLMADSSTKMQTLQVRLFGEETRGGIEHFEPFGFTSCPLPGAEPFAVFPSGDRSHGIVLIVADRRYRLTGLAAGEVALHDDQGQKVHITRTGIVIQSALKVRITAADIELHASHSYSWDVGGFGERWTANGAGNWEHKTWQTGATITSVSLSTNPPEGP